VFALDIKDISFCVGTFAPIVGATFDIILEDSNIFKLNLFHSQAQGHYYFHDT
jgi:hypothetical protein